MTRPCAAGPAGVEDALEALLASRDTIVGRMAGAQLVLFARRGFTSSRLTRRAAPRRAARERVLLIGVKELFE